MRNDSSKEATEAATQELIQAKKKRSASIINAVFVFLTGIILYSVFKNTWGLLTLIPLIFAYKLTRPSADSRQEINEALKDRNLK